MLEFQTLFPDLANTMDLVYRGSLGGRAVGWVVEAGGETKEGSSIYLNRKQLLCAY